MGQWFDLVRRSYRLASHPVGGSTSRLRVCQTSRAEFRPLGSRSPRLRAAAVLSRRHDVGANRIGLANWTAIAMIITILRIRRCRPDDRKFEWVRPVIVFHAEIAVKRKAKTCITTRKNMCPLTWYQSPTWHQSWLLPAIDHDDALTRGELYETDCTVRYDRWHERIAHQFAESPVLQPSPSDYLASTLSECRPTNARLALWEKKASRPAGRRRLESTSGVSTAACQSPLQGSA